MFALRTTKPGRTSKSVARRREGKLSRAGRRPRLEALESRLALSSIAGSLYEDMAANGARDLTDPAFVQAGVTVYLDQNQNATLDAGEVSTLTDSAGNYSFTGLSAGTYHVAQSAQSLPAGTLQSGPAPTAALGVLGQVDRQWASPDATPTGVASFGGNLYVAAGMAGAGQDNALSIVRQSDGVVLGQLPLAGFGVDLLTYDNTNSCFWGTDNESNRIIQFDAGGNLQKSFASPAASTWGIAWDGDSLRVVANRQIYDVSPASPDGGAAVQLSPSIAVPADATNVWGLTCDGVNLWLSAESSSGGFVLYRLDAANGQVLQAMAAPQRREVTGMAFDGQAMWLAQVYEATLSRMNVSTPASQTVAVDGAGNISNVDFGDFRLGSTSGTVYNDVNANGTRDSGEAGLAGWRAYSDTNGNGRFDGWEPQAITDSGGVYNLTGLIPGSYQVAIEPRSPGWSVPPSSASVDVAKSGQTVTGPNFGAALSGVGPIGGESLVNWTTPGTQQVSFNHGLSKFVGMDSTGNYAVVWYGKGQVDSDGVFVRLFNADGTPRTGEILVNTTTAGSQTAPSIAMTPGGAFTVAWSTPGGSGSSVYARTFNADGSPRTAPFAVFNKANTSFGGATDQYGNFIVFAGESASNTYSYVDAQRFTALGQSQGSTIRFRTYIASPNSWDVAMDNNGNFVLAWNSAATGSWQIVAQRYDKTGKAQGGQIAVSPGMFVSVAMNSVGDFALAWDNGARQARIYSANGTPRTSAAFNLGPNLGPAGQYITGISFVDNGTVVFVNPIGEVMGQRFDATTSAPIDAAPFRVNTTLTPVQPGGNFSSSVAGRSGRLIAAWGGSGLGDTSGVFAQRYGTSAALPAAAPAAGLSAAAMTSSPSPSGGRLTSPKAVDAALADTPPAHQASIARRSLDLHALAAAAAHQSQFGLTRMAGGKRTARAADAALARLAGR